MRETENKLYRLTRRNWSLSSRIEWRPDSDNKLSFTSLYSIFTDDEARDNYIFDTDDRQGDLVANTAACSTAINPTPTTTGYADVCIGNTPLQGTIYGIDINQRSTLRAFRQSIFTNTLAGDHRFGDGWKLKWAANYTRSVDDRSVVGEARWDSPSTRALRPTVAYDFSNPGYRDFPDFLDSLRSAKRKMIRKEREAVARSGLEIQVLTGADLGDGVLDDFWPFYMATVEKRWGNAYLTQDFFRRLGRTLGERVVLVRARDGKRTVAVALNLVGRDALYGRIWGSLEEYRFLHFELCYYRAIEWAITNKLQRVEAGAQGLHKVQRGYAPVFTHSAHLIGHPGLRDAIERFLKQERQAVRAERAELQTALPFSSLSPISSGSGTNDQASSTS